jgi:hypothetical protein
MEKDEIEEIERELNKILDESEEDDWHEIGDDAVKFTKLNREKILMNISWYIQDNFKKKK